MFKLYRIWSIFDNKYMKGWKESNQMNGSNSIGFLEKLKENGSTNNCNLFSDTNFPGISQFNHSLLRSARSYYLAVNW